MHTVKLILVVLIISEAIIGTSLHWQVIAGDVISEQNISDMVEKNHIEENDNVVWWWKKAKYFDAQHF